MSNLSVTGRQWIPFAAMFLCCSSEALLSVVSSSTQSLTPKARDISHKGTEKVTLDCGEM